MRRGLQAGPAAALVGGVAQQSQAKVHPSELQADLVGLAAVQASEGMQIGAADQQGTRAAGGAVGQLEVDRGARLLQRKVAVDLHKTKHVQGQMPGHLQQLAFAAVQAQGQVAGGSGQDRQIGFARAVVDHRGVGRCAVDLQLQAVGGDAQPLHTHKGGAGDAGLCAGPSARGDGAAVDLAFADKGQANVHALDRQAQSIGLAAVDTGKARQAMSAKQQQVDIDGAGRFVGLGGRDIGQGDGATAFFQPKVTRDLERAEHIDVEVACGTGQLTQGCVHRQSHAGGCHAGAGLHLQALGQVVNQAAIGGGTVDGDGQGVNRHGQSTHAAEAGGPHLRAQAAPVARRGPGVVDIGFFSGQNQTHIGLGDVQAHGAGGAPAHTGKGLGDVGTQREQVHLNGFFVAQGELGIALFDVKRALGLHKAKGVQGERPTGVGELTFGAVQAQGERGACGAAGHTDRVGGVVDHQGAGLLRGHLLGVAHLGGLQGGAQGRGLGHHRDRRHIQACQVAAKLQQQSLAVPEGDGDVTAPGGGDGRLNLGLTGRQGQAGGGLALVGQREAAVLGVGGEGNALHFGHCGVALGQVVRRGRGEGQTAGVGAEVGHVHTGQGPREAQGEVRGAGGRTGVVIDHRDVVGRPAEGTDQCRLDVGSLGGLGGTVGDVAGGLAVVADGEAAAGGQRRQGDLGLQHGHIDPRQTAAKTHTVGMGPVGGDRHRAHCAERGVEGAGHIGGAGTQRQGAGGVGRGALFEAEFEGAAGGGIEHQTLHLVGGRCALGAVQRQHIAGHRLADHQVGDVGLGQAAREADGVAVATPGVAAVKSYGDGAGVGWHTQQSGHASLDVGRIVGDVVLHEAHCRHRAGGARQAQVVVALGGIGGREQQSFDFVAASPGRHHLGHADIERGTEHAVGDDDDVFDFVDGRHGAGVGGDRHRHSGHRRCHGQAGDGAATQAADKLDVIALDAVARDTHVAGTHRGQAFQARGERGDDLGVGFLTGQGDLRGARPQGEAQTTRRLAREVQVVDGVLDVAR